MSIMATAPMQGTHRAPRAVASAKGGGRMRGAHRTHGCHAHVVASPAGTVGRAGVTRRRVVAGLGTAVVSAGLACCLSGCAHGLAYAVTSTPITASADDAANPRRGWTRLVSHVLTDEGAGPDDLGDLGGLPADVRLLVVEVNLREFRDVELSPAALDQADAVLTACARGGRALVVRYLYDWDGQAAQTEPADLSLVERHMAQLGPVTSAHADDVLCLQGVFVGDYGETHGTDKTDRASVVELARTLAREMDPAIPLCVRTPAQLRAIVAADPDLTGRFGLFDDGILGSETDLGTYASASDLEASGGQVDGDGRRGRADELAFQSALCATVPNGGETVAGGIDDGVEQLSTLAQMRLTYLSRQYDPALLGLWRTRRFSAEAYAALLAALPAHETILADARAFDGATLLDFVGAHLGYRLVPCGCELRRPPSLVERLAGLARGDDDDGASDASADGDAVVVRVANVGFACAYRDLAATLALVPQGEAAGGDALSLSASDPHVASWQTGDRGELLFPLPAQGLARGNYELRLSLSDVTRDGDATGEPIRLACADAGDDGSVAVGTLRVE